VSEPRERSGDHGVPASEHEGGAGGAKPPGLRTVTTLTPCYNEAENVALMLDAVLGVFDENGIDGRILVIDDASPDGTAEIVDERARTEPRVAVLRRAQKEGLGLAYRDGFRQVVDDGAETIVQMDCDFSHDPAVIPAMLDALGEADLVLGSRYVRGGGVVGWPLVRQAISKGGCLYARLVLGIPVRDLTGGFKAWRSGVVEYLLGRARDSDLTFTVDLETCEIRDGGAWRSEFAIEEAARQMLLQGLDQIGQTLLYEAEIAKYEGAHS